MRSAPLLDELARLNDLVRADLEPYRQRVGEFPFVLPA